MNLVADGEQVAEIDFYGYGTTIHPPPIEWLQYSHNRFLQDSNSLDLYLHPPLWRSVSNFGGSRLVVENHCVAVNRSEADVITQSIQSVAPLYFWACNGY